MVPFGDSGHLQGLKSPYFKESHINLRLAMRKWFAKEILAEALECEKTDRAPTKELRMETGRVGVIAMTQGPGPHLKWAPNGLMGGVVQPEEFDYFHELIVQEERARAMTPGFEDGLDGAVSIGLPCVLKFGSPKMKQEIAPAVLRGEKTVCLAISEAFAGSDVANLRTRAHLDASGENFIVNGTKKWITGGMYADYFVTAVRTGKAGAGGLSLLLVPRSDAVQTKIIKSSYSSSAGTAFVTYENAVVPKEYLIGDLNKGFSLIMSNFNHERWMISVVCAIRARVCNEEVFKWAMQRKVFGKPLIEQPVIREKLAQSVGALESVTAMLYDVTHQMVHLGPLSAQIGGRIALLKYMTTRMCHLVSDNSVQILGGRGVTQSGMGRVVNTFYKTYKVPSVYGSFPFPVYSNPFSPRNSYIPLFIV
eukprot:Lithocolla_globosa_v1_NODE_2945_length_1815_cov_5.456250.p1 type:complete len:422 gc:universal NODE_2945_length_1815_cov_5.456250:1366-101(-)